MRLAVRIQVYNALTRLRTEPALRRAPLTGAPQAKGSEGQIETLTRVCADDLLEAFGLCRTHTASGRPQSDRPRTGLRRLATSAAGPLFRPPARRLAKQVAAYDEIVGAEGLAAGGSWALKRLSRGLRVEGAENIPSAGPVLVVSNHPGLADSLSLFAALPRRDLRIVAAERAFLQALPNTSRYLIPVGEHPGERPAALGGLRAASRHLRQGGALLTFPAGAIEPDPAIMAGAQDSLQSWQESLQVFIRVTPEATVVPAVVSGVISASALSNPLIRLRRRTEDRRWLAASLQMLVPSLRDIHTEVRFGRPIQRDESRQAPGLEDEVLDEAQRLIGEVRSR